VKEDVLASVEGMDKDLRALLNITGAPNVSQIFYDGQKYCYRRARISLDWPLSFLEVGKGAKQTFARCTTGSHGAARRAASDLELSTASIAACSFKPIVFSAAAGFVNRRGHSSHLPASSSQGYSINLATRRTFLHGAIATTAGASLLSTYSRPAKAEASHQDSGGASMSLIESQNGTHVYYEDLAPDSSRGTILFVHGWPVSGRMFEYQANVLPNEGIRVITIDLRGFGRSSKPWGPYGYDDWANDIRAVVDQLNLSDVTLAGFSMGGAVAMHYMDQHKGHGVARLALLAAAGPCLGLRSDNPNGISREAHDGFVAAAIADRAKLNADFGSLLFNKPVSPEMDRFFWEMGMEASSRATVRGVEELRDRDLRLGAARIEVPTLICHGVHDKIIPFALGAEVQAELIKGSTLVRFEESGHGLFLDERDKLNTELARFALGQS